MQKATPPLPAAPKRARAINLNLPQSQAEVLDAFPPDERNQVITDAVRAWLDRNQGDQDAQLRRWLDQMPFTDQNEYRSAAVALTLTRREWQIIDTMIEADHWIPWEICLCDGRAVGDLPNPSPRFQYIGFPKFGRLTRSKVFETRTVTLDLHGSWWWQLACWARYHGKTLDWAVTDCIRREVDVFGLYDELPDESQPAPTEAAVGLEDLL